ncbi:MAG: Hsp70 family protein [Aeromicrobium sp.]
MTIGFDLGALGPKVALGDDSAPVRRLSEPRSRVLNELAARVGDRVPLIDRSPNGEVTEQLAHHRYAELLIRSIEQLRTGRKGGDVVAVAVPVWWTPRAKSLIHQAMAAAGQRRVVFVTDAEAAVRAYRARVGTVAKTLAVVDIGAQDVSAAVLHECDSESPQVVGHAGFLHGAGGDDLDTRILQHVLTSLREQGAVFDASDPGVVAASNDLLRQCQEVKETLSTTSVATFTPQMPGVVSRFRLVRSEFDELARTWVQDIVRVVRDCIESTDHGVSEVLLVGGSSRIPAVAQQISAELGVLVYADDDPQTSTTRGAVLAASSTRSRPRTKRSGQTDNGWLPRPKRHRKSDQRRRGGKRAGVIAAALTASIVGVGDTPRLAYATPSDSARDSETNLAPPQALRSVPRELTTSETTPANTPPSANLSPLAHMPQLVAAMLTDAPGSPGILTAQLGVRPKVARTPGKSSATAKPTEPVSSPPETSSPQPEPATPPPDTTSVPETSSPEPDPASPPPDTPVPETVDTSTEVAGNGGV